MKNRKHVIEFFVETRDCDGTYGSHGKQFIVNGNPWHCFKRLRNKFESTIDTDETQLGKILFSAVPLESGVFK